MTDTPHPVSLETAFTFARHMRHHEFRRHVWSLAPKGCPVVCTRAGEDPAALDARVRDTLVDHPGYDTALVVRLDDTQRWGLRIVHRPPADTEDDRLDIAESRRALADPAPSIPLDEILTRHDTEETDRAR